MVGQVVFLEMVSSIVNRRKFCFGHVKKNEIITKLFKVIFQEREVKVFKYFSLRKCFFFQVETIDLMNFVSR